MNKFKWIAENQEYLCNIQIKQLKEISQANDEQEETHSLLS